MTELNAILERLRDGIALLDERTAGLVVQTKNAESAEAKANELKESLDAQAKDLDAREAKVKHIENIVEREDKANSLMEEAGKIMTNAEQAQKKLAGDVQKAAQEKAAGLKQVADGEDANKRQADALIKERGEFEDKVKAAKAMASALK